MSDSIICPPLAEQKFHEFQITRISASGGENDKNSENNVIDTDFETRWSSRGKDQYLILEPKYEDQNLSINQIKISFYKGDTRKQFFKIQASEDNNNYDDISGDLESSGITDGLETYSFPNSTRAKYIKILCKGNDADGSEGDWNSITTVKLTHDSQAVPGEYKPTKEGDDRSSSFGGGSSGDLAKTKEGVELKYPSKKIKYDFERNFRDDGKRFDFEGLGSSFASSELTGYFRFIRDPVNDEVSGKQGGGLHSNGTRPRCYDVGVHIRSGKTRYRMEERHHDMINGDRGGEAEPLRDKFIGYKFIKKNEANGVRLQFWQDTGNNDGDTPANEWTLVSDWLETRHVWRTSGADHQETIRIDDPDEDGLRNLEFKWISLSEIETP